MSQIPKLNPDISQLTKKKPTKRNYYIGEAINILPLDKVNCLHLKQQLAEWEDQDSTAKQSTAF